MKTSEFEPQAERKVAPATRIDPTVKAEVDRRLPVKREVRFYVGLLGLFVVYLTIFMALWVVAPVALAGWTPVVITSGSMSPSIGVGDVVVVSPHDGQNLRPGQVVVFEDRVFPGNITHRIIEVNADGSYLTKGDANAQPDSAPLQPDQVVGRARLLVPLIGLPFKWLSTGEWLNLFLWIGVTGSAVVVARYAQVAKYDPWSHGKDRLSGDVA